MMLLVVVGFVAAAAGGDPVHRHPGLASSARLHGEVRKLRRDLEPALPPAAREAVDGALAKHASAMVAVDAAAARGDEAGARVLLGTLKKSEGRAKSLFDVGGRRRCRAAGRGRGRGRARSALRATPAALEAATGIAAAEPVWGAPFREMAALFDGEPPLEALGVFLQLPCPKWACRWPRPWAPRARAALDAPPLVGAWLDAVGAAAGELPVFGFGVDRDAGAAKVYAMSQPAMGRPCPTCRSRRRAPRAADAALPRARPTAGGSEAPRMLSLEWVLGSSDVALRQYFVEDLGDDGGAPREPRPLRLARRRGARGRLGRPRARLPRRDRGHRRDAVLRPGVPAARGRRARRLGAKVGLRLDSAPRDGAAEVAAALAAARVDGAAAAAWAAASAGVAHAVSNVQVFYGSIFFYDPWHLHGLVDGYYGYARLHLGAVRRPDVYSYACAYDFHQAYGVW
ncbi:hypothetical protein SO694_00049293 [Aureococcus anophagefferens]|uniref:Uncharacterized protein n=1 Tax=Aureococcus anophagefferens TaxID=44056 RepID=A0ABR1G841_AURAN